MHKVIAVNLHDQVYQLDERAYEILRAYLDRTDAQLATNPDRNEIVRDLEQSIGEKFVRSVSPTKTVVTTSDVERVLAEIGPVDGGTNHTTTANTSAGTPERTPKRLFQIRDGAMISGLCNGLAAYFNLDPTIVRVAAVFAAIIETSVADRPPVVTVGIYTVLVFLVPYAKATSERGATQGANEAFPDKVQHQVERVRGFFGLRHSVR